MTWRGARILTLLLLVLLVASPLSPVDKGLWLSLTPTPAQHLEAAPNHLTAELSVVVPDDAARIVGASDAARSERIEAPKTLGLAGAAWPPGSGERWTIVVSPPRLPHGATSASRSAPRAPPA